MVFGNDVGAVIVIKVAVLATVVDSIVISVIVITVFVFSVADIVNCSIHHFLTTSQYLFLRDWDSFEKYW